MYFRLVLSSLALMALPAAGEPTKTSQPASGDKVLRTALALYDGVREETLSNGLRVFLKPIPGSPVVATMMVYKVGSADEDLDHTGLSHYLEHLMFKGTDKLMPGDIDRMTQQNGGQNNANTSEDMTVFHFDFAADRWKVALAIEADRMSNLRIDSKHEFQQEKGAVISELDMYEDQPWDLEEKTLLPILFGPRTPYGHPVIGEKRHVREATAEVIKKHYDHWYHPNNAVLVLAGGFDQTDAWETIQKLFGPIPRADLPPRNPIPIQKPRTETVRKKFESKFTTPRLLIGFNTVTETDADSIPLDVVSVLLSSGKTSRLHVRLVEDDESATSTEANHSSGRYPGWFSIRAELFKAEDLPKVENAINAELTRLADDGPTNEELKRVRRSMAAAHIFAHESVHELADTIARGRDPRHEVCPPLSAGPHARVRRGCKEGDEEVSRRSQAGRDRVDAKDGGRWRRRQQRSAARQEPRPSQGCCREFRSAASEDCYSRERAQADPLGESSPADCRGECERRPSPLIRAGGPNRCCDPDGHASRGGDQEPDRARDCESHRGRRGRFEHDRDRRQRQGAC